VRREVLVLLDLKNAVGRAEWVRRYYSGHFCDDLRTEAERRRFAAWYSEGVAEAEKFLGAPRGH
jgi:hypothetical protein